MAVIKGVKERVHLPLYDSLTVEPEEQLREVESSNKLKFFVNVQGKTRLETNMQSASLLPHYNTYEARAMRVIKSDLPPEFPDKPTASDSGYDVVDDSEDENPFLIDTAGYIGVRDSGGNVISDISESSFSKDNNPETISADIEIGLNRIVELLKEAREGDGYASLNPEDEEVTLIPDAANTKADTIAGFGGTIWLSTHDLESLISYLPEKESPLKFQIQQNNGAGTLISKFIYNTVTSFFVGEKVMIEAPTWFFPGGAGPFSDQAAITTHGMPSPIDTFRFAEPIYLDKQQNFRVEIEIPNADTLKELQRLYGPLFIWVVIDGYMTRDVQ